MPDVKKKKKRKKERQKKRKERKKEKRKKEMFIHFKKIPQGNYLDLER